MPALVSIRVPPQQVAELSALVSPKGFRKAQLSALNEVKRGGVKMVSDEVRAVMTVSAKYAKRAVYGSVVRDANPPDLTFFITKQLIPIVGFKHSVTKRGGVKWTAFKELAPLTLRHAFKSRMIGALPSGVVSGDVGAEGGAGSPGKGGHVGIFLRRKGIGGPWGTSHAKRPYDRKRPRKVGPKGYAHRLPTREVFGPSIYELLQAHGKLSGVGRRVLDAMLKRYLDRLESKVFSGAKAFR